MPNVDIKQQQAVNKKGLAEGLPSPVDRGVAKYEVWGSEVPVCVDKYFRPEHKVQIPHIYHLKIWSEHPTVCNRYYSELASKQII